MMEKSLTSAIREANKIIDGWGPEPAQAASVESYERIALSVAEAAQLMAVHINTMRNLIKSGQVPSVIIGGRRLISYAKLKELVDAPAAQGDFTYTARGANTKRDREVKLAKAKAMAAQQQSEAAD